MQTPHPSHILLISKDEDLVRAVLRAIDDAAEKASVDVAASGKLALNRLAVTDYDLVLADSTAPDVSINSMIEDLQTRVTHTPLVVLYEKDEQELAERALARGAADVLEKPIHPSFLGAALRRLQLGQLSRRLADQQAVFAQPGPAEALSAVQEELASQLADVSRLHELSGRLSVSLDLPPILQEVLAAVTELMVAEVGVMSFYDSAQNELAPVASIGMSEEYLKTLARVPLGEGISGVAAKERRRVSLEDMEKYGEAPLREAARAAGLRAAHSVPLIARSNELIGVVTTFFRRSHRPSNRELRLVDLYLRQATEVIDNARLHQASRSATDQAERYATQLLSVTQAVLALNASRSLDDTLRLVTEQARAVIGAHYAVTTLGKEWPHTTAVVSVSDAYKAYRESQPAGARIVAEICTEKRPRRLGQDDLRDHFIAGGVPLRGWLAVPLIGRDGRIIGVIQICDKAEGQFTAQDEAVVVQLAQMASANLENVRLYGEAEAAERRVAFLAEAGAVLARSLDFEVTLRNVAQLVVPHLADWCLVDLIRPDGLMERMAVAHVDPYRAPQAEVLRRRHRLDPLSVVGAARVMRSGWPEMFYEITEEALPAIARDEQDLEALRALSIQSCICAPLHARGRNLGVMTFLTAESGRRYGPDHRMLVREVARRAALAVEHALLYQQAQDAIRRKDESLALLDTLLGTAPIGFALVDRDLRYVRINDSLAAMDGVPREEHLGRTVTEVLPTLAGILTPIFAHVLSTGEPVVNHEVHGETPALPGVPRDWLTSFYPVTVPSGQMLGVGVVVTEITERKRVEEQVKTSLKEKEVLLKEIHHRVKNNLQIISSLLRLQSDNPHDKHSRGMLEESQNRIRSMALIHEKLYQSHDLSSIDFTEYIRSLAASLFASYRVDVDTVTLEVDAEPVLLEVDAAIPCGLILNELVTNALKYAFPRKRRGIIKITLRAEDDVVTLSVADNGVGLPKGLDFRNVSSLGLQLVTTLMDQLEGTITLVRGQGTEFRISFPSAKPTAR